jgi:hypothetical protein
VHDNQHLINWALVEANNYGGFERQLAWLAGVLEARDFPLQRLARNLEIAATIVTASSPGRCPRSCGMARTSSDRASGVRAKRT